MNYLAITPHDPLIARDSRPFGAGVRMKSLDWPNPSVLAGSLRTALGKMQNGNFNEDTFKTDVVNDLKNISIHGPLPLFSGRLYFPAPKDVLVKDCGDKFETYAIRPANLHDGEHCDLPHNDLLPAMLPESVIDDFKPADIAPLWCVGMMVAWLTNPGGTAFHAPVSPEKRKGKPSPPQQSSAKCTEKLDSLSLPKKESRFHVAIDPRRGSAKESMLFETIGLDFSLEGRNEGVSLTARIESAGRFDAQLATLDAIGTMGGERRLSHWKRLEEVPEGWTCPDGIRTALQGSKNIRMVLATPAIFSGGWCPGWINKTTLTGTPPGVEDLTLKLVSACVDRWRPLSGWNMERGHKRGPKPIRRLVPAGSVYFFKVTNGGAGGVLADRWLRPVSDEDQDRKDGFGLALWGAWEYGGDRTTNELKKEE